jgi:hypothetical protein
VKYYSSSFFAATKPYPRAFRRLRIGNQSELGQFQTVNLAETLDGHEKLSRAMRGCTRALCVLLGLLLIAPEATRAEDPFDQSKSAARAWQLAQKLGPFLDDPFVVVPVGIPSGAVTHQSALVEKSLASFSLDPKPGNHVRILDDGRYILYGDLFKTGEKYALVELPVMLESDPYWDGARIAFAQLVSGKWQLRGLWDVNCTWQSADDAKKDDEHFPVTPAETPFQLTDFDGDGVPEVILAGEVWRDYQNYYILHFDPKTHSIQMLAAAMGKPEFCDGYIRLYYNSGHRSIFEEWDFLKLSGSNIKEVASWHDGAPYNPGDDEGLRAEALNDQGQLEEFEIDDVEGKTSASTYEIWRRGTGKGIKVATVAFSKKDIKDTRYDLDSEKMEKVWLFHHITDLPADTLPMEGYAADEKGKALPPLARYESVKISGSPEFVRKLKRVQ